jgi:putative ABC transport system substrate-binding protein
MSWQLLLDQSREETCSNRQCSVVVFQCATTLAALATAARLPIMFGFREQDGGLMSYGIDLRENWRRGAIYVDKILKGAIYR